MISSPAYWQYHFCYHYPYPNPYHISRYATYFHTRNLSVSWRFIYIQRSFGSRPISQIPQCTSPIYHNAQFCNRNVHISVTKWCVMGYLSDAFWDLWDGSIRSGTHFTNDFSITIQIRWKFHLALIQLLMIKSRKNLAHATTAQLSCHVPNIVAITFLVFGWEQNEISITFELWWKNC